MVVGEHGRGRAWSSSSSSTLVWRELSPAVGGNREHFRELSLVLSKYAPHVQEYPSELLQKRN